MNSLLETQSNSKMNLVWTEKMDNCLIEALIKQVHKGNKIDGRFTSLAYQVACTELYSRCQVKVSVAF